MGQIGHKIYSLIITFCIIIVSQCQFSSFVPDYLFDVPKQFITHVPVTKPLDNYLKFQSPVFSISTGDSDEDSQQLDEGEGLEQDEGEGHAQQDDQQQDQGEDQAEDQQQVGQEGCAYPFVRVQGNCQCPQGSIYDEQKQKCVKNGKLGVQAVSNDDQDVSQSQNQQNQQQIQNQQNVDKADQQKDIGISDLGLDDETVLKIGNSQIRIPNRLISRLNTNKNKRGDKRLVININTNKNKNKKNKTKTKISRRQEVLDEDFGDDQNNFQFGQNQDEQMDQIDNIGELKDLGDDQDSANSWNDRASRKVATKKNIRRVIPVIEQQDDNLQEQSDNKIEQQQQTSSTNQVQGQEEQSEKTLDQTGTGTETETETETEGQDESQGQIQEQNQDQSQGQAINFVDDVNTDDSNQQQNQVQEKAQEPDQGQQQQQKTIQEDQQQQNNKKPQPKPKNITNNKTKPSNIKTKVQVSKNDENKNNGSKGKQKDNIRTSANKSIKQIDKKEKKEIKTNKIDLKDIINKFRNSPILIQNNTFTLKNNSISNKKITIQINDNTTNQNSSQDNSSKTNKIVVSNITLINNNTNSNITLSAAKNNTAIPSTNVSNETNKTANSSLLVSITTNGSNIIKETPISPNSSTTIPTTQTQPQTPTQTNQTQPTNTTPAQPLNTTITNTTTIVIEKVQCPVLKVDQIKSNDTIEALAHIFRNYDGSGNNLDNPSWGSTGTLLERRIAPNYVDGVRIPVDGLPNPRLISNTVGEESQNITKSSINVTYLFTVFGQFVDHDIDLTFAQRTTRPNAEFMNIQVPENDSFFKQQKFIQFTRSSFVQNQQNQFRRHKNFITAWIDGSQVYGSDENTNCALRAYQKGKLKTSGDNNEFLPLFGDFFRAGDVRAIQNSILTSIQTIFVRQHNRVCDQILKKNPKFNDQTIFQIARNFVVGLIQKITMKDFLPLMLGDQYKNLIGQYQGYKNNINPNIPTQFSTAVYRAGHALILSKIPLINQAGQTQQQVALSDMFFKQDFFASPDFLTKAIRGCSKTVVKQKNGKFVEDLRNLLVLDPIKRQVKLDLFSLNIQRGRDHGLPSYNTVRSIFGLEKIKKFEQLVPKRQIQYAKKLQALYGDPDKIDLYVGVVAETPVKNGVLGELGAKVVGQTFRNLRDGDRFWYEGAYPKAIIEQIQKTKFGDICRRNTLGNGNDLPSDLFQFIAK